MADRISWVRRQLTPAEKSVRSLGDAALDHNILRISCAKCAHAVARLAHLMPKFPDALLSELAKGLVCSKCSSKSIEIEEVVWCEEASEILSAHSGVGR